jgi:mannose-1-phosphate guanylyltransferase / mannose-6-phosphate isomerase
MTTPLHPPPPLLPVILSGGSGTRLWPLSREAFPKQFHALLGERTLLQETVDRALRIPGALPPLLVCGEETRFLAAGQLQAMGVTPSGILLEPVGRNTAPAVTLAALRAQRKWGPDTAAADPLLLILPADHGIRHIEAFVQAVEAGIPAADAGWVVTFGIPPHRPETGYGYIELGGALEPAGAAPIHQIARFREKPDLATAERYVADGRHLWNAGMFLVRAGRLLEEMARHRPDILAACEATLAASRHDLDFFRLDAEAFARCPSESLDYAVMEPTDRGAVVVADGLGWSDVGSWEALWEAREKDADGNILQGDVLAVGTRNSYLHSEDRLIATVGVDDLMVVETPDAILVAHKAQSQEVKGIVDQLRALGRTEPQLHRKVDRPWGSYDPIDSGPSYQVKHITVRPGGRLSLQKHRHRAEHWVVVRGRARVTCEDRVFDLEPNQSTYIPLGAVHRLENPFTDPVHLIEVQSGDYLGEDDIIRIEDVYGRGDSDSG